MAFKRRSLYARGTKSQAMDDRTGKKVNYTDLRKEWTGHMVHKDEWEAKHPQLTPRGAVDAEILRSPRVDNDNVQVFVKGRQIRGIEMRLSLLGDIATTTVTAKALPSGVVGTFALGTEVPTASAVPSGVAGTFAAGNISSGIILAGVAITSAIGAESISAGVNLSVTGVAITSAVGNEIPVSVVLETGVAITSAVGTIEILRDVWGDGTWGDGTWGS